LAFGICLFLSAWAQPGMSPTFGKSTCTPALNYRFKGKLVMESEIKSEAKDTLKMTMEMHFNDTTNIVAVKIKLPGVSKMNMTSIISKNDSIMIMLMDMGSIKSSSCHKMGELKNAQSKKPLPTTAWKANNFIATGNTKTICGFICKELKSVTDTITMNLWVAPDLKNWAYGNAGIQGNPLNEKNIPEDMLGMTLEMTMIDIVKKYSMHMKAIEVNKTEILNINTEGYNIR